MIFSTKEILDFLFQKWLLDIFYVMKKWNEKTTSDFQTF